MKKDVVVFMLMQATYESDISRMRSKILSVVEGLSKQTVDIDSSVRARIVSIVGDSGGITKKRLISTTAGIESASKVKVSEILSQMVVEGIIDVDSKKKIGSNRAIVYVLRGNRKTDDVIVEMKVDDKLPPAAHLARARMVRGVIIDVMKTTADKKDVIDKTKQKTGVPHDVVLKQYKNVTELGLTDKD